MGPTNHTVLRLPKHCVLFLAIMPKQSLIKMEQEDDDCNSEEFDIDNQIQELEQELLSAFDDEMEATTEALNDEGGVEDKDRMMKKKEEDDRGDPLWTTMLNTDPAYDKGEEEEVEVEVDEEELENAADDEVGVVKQGQWLMPEVDEEMIEEVEEEVVEMLKKRWMKRWRPTILCKNWRPSMAVGYAHPRQCEGSVSHPGFLGEYSYAVGAPDVVPEEVHEAPAQEQQFPQSITHSTRALPSSSSSTVCFPPAPRQPQQPKAPPPRRLLPKANPPTQAMKRCVNDKCKYTAHGDVQKYSGFCCGKCRHWWNSRYKKGTPDQHGPNCACIRQTEVGDG